MYFNSDDNVVFGHYVMRGKISRKVEDDDHPRWRAGDMRELSRRSHAAEESRKRGDDGDDKECALKVMAVFGHNADKDAYQHLDDGDSRLEIVRWKRLYGPGREKYDKKTITSSSDQETATSSSH